MGALLMFPSLFSMTSWVLLTVTHTLVFGKVCGKLSF